MLALPVCPTLSALLFLEGIDQSGHLEMILSNSVIQIVGGIMCLIGVAGIFLHISQDDGALAIAGAIVFASGTVSRACPKST